MLHPPAAPRPPRPAPAFDQHEGIEVAWNQVELAGNHLDEQQWERLFAEIRVLKQLTHKNIMSFHDWWYDSRNATINFITEVRGCRGSFRAGVSVHSARAPQPKPCCDAARFDGNTLWARPRIPAQAKSGKASPNRCSSKASETTQ